MPKVKIVKVKLRLKEKKTNMLKEKFPSNSSELETKSLRLKAAR